MGTRHLYCLVDKAVNFNLTCITLKKNITNAIIQTLCNFTRILIVHQTGRSVLLHFLELVFQTIFRNLFSKWKHWSFSEWVLRIWQYLLGVFLKMHSLSKITSKKMSESVNQMNFGSQKTNSGNHHQTDPGYLEIAVSKWT